MFQKTCFSKQTHPHYRRRPGLGKASAQRFLELGATVYICGRRHDVLAATEGGTPPENRRPDPQPPMRCRDAAAVEEMIDHHLERMVRSTFYEIMQPKLPGRVPKSCRSAPSSL